MKKQILSASLVVLGLPAACGDKISDQEGAITAPAQTEERVTPLVEATSHARVSVGQTLELFGQGFIKERQGSTQVRFEGTFYEAIGASGQLTNPTPVSLTVNPVYGGVELNGAQRSILTIPRVGPFSNPFTRDARPGRFDGTIQVVNTYTDGFVDAGPQVPMRLDIAPSIVIEELRPVHADCGAPAVRVFSGLPYVMKVRVGGIKANRFIYEFNQINGDPSVTTFDHVISSVTETDGVGESSEIVVFNPIPEDQQSYVTGVRVMAFDEEGHYAETALPIGVHRPIEVVYSGKYELAERYEPVPVSGCIPGGVGNSVSYSESTTETRTQSVSVTISSNWSTEQGREVSSQTSEGISIGESTSTTLGESASEREALSETVGEEYEQSTANSVGFSTTNGESWEWNMSQGESNEEYQSRTASQYGEVSGSVSVGVSGEGSIAGFAKVSGEVETTVGVSAGMSTGTSSGASQRTSTERGYSMGGSSSNTQSFGSVTTEGTSKSVEGTYAIGRSTGSSSSTSMGMSQGRAWDLSEGTSVSEVVSEDNAEALSEATVTSTSRTVGQELSGFIPRGRFGIFYRQTTRWVRRAEVRSFDLCGVASHMGELQFNEWDWAPDLAIGDECGAVPPPSTMPSARCFVQPCGE